MLPRVRHGTQLIELDPVNSEVLASGDDDAAIPALEVRLAGVFRELIG